MEILRDFVRNIRGNRVLVMVFASMIFAIVLCFTTILRGSGTHLVLLSFFLAFLIALSFSGLVSAEKRRKRELVKLREETGKAVTESSLLFEMGKLLSSRLDLRSCLELLLTSVLKTLGADMGSVMLLDEESGELTIKVAQGLDEKIIRETCLKLGEGIAGWVAKEEEPLLINDVSEDKRFKATVKREGLCSALCVPLKIKGKVIGVLNMGTTCPGEFTPEDLQLLGTLASQAAIVIENARLFGEMERLYFDTIRAFAAAIEAKDPYTHGHSERVATYAVAIAEAMRLGEEEVQNVQAAALLHDIGKIGVGEGILNKVTRLTREEYELVKTHPLVATQIVKHVPLFKDILPSILHHHERYDGDGYLDGLEGERIPLGARILAVADAFEAMTSERPYRKALTPDEALAELRRSSGTQFDPQIVDVFCKIVEGGFNGGEGSKPTSFGCGFAPDPYFLSEISLESSGYLV